jgi:hypothetical protein
MFKSVWRAASFPSGAEIRSVFTHGPRAQRHWSRPPCFAAYSARSARSATWAMASCGAAIASPALKRKPSVSL